MKMNEAIAKMVEEIMQEDFISPDAEPTEVEVKLNAIIEYYVKAYRDGLIAYVKRGLNVMNPS